MRNLPAAAEWAAQPEEQVMSRGDCDACSSAPPVGLSIRCAAEGDLPKLHFIAGQRARLVREDVRHLSAEHQPLHLLGLSSETERRDREAAAYEHWRTTGVRPQLALPRSSLRLVLRAFAYFPVESSIVGSLLTKTKPCETGSMTGAERALPTIVRARYTTGQTTRQGDSGVSGR